LSYPLPAPQLSSSLDDDAWDDLLNYIEERRVIPIIGPELLRVETETGPRAFQEWLAERLAARLNIDLSRLPQPPSLDDVVSWHVASRGRREEPYTRLRSILRDATFAPPAALRRLAEITDFDLFVTTTFDGYLEQAINEARFSGLPSTEVISYAPNRIADLTVERAQMTRPVVYHLLGRVSASPTYVISDEDTLEFMCALQSEHLTPEKLFHELENNHLLLIGSNFSNWLVRLFLRMAKRRRLSDPRDVGEVLADDHSSRDERLMAFLQQVSLRTRGHQGAEDFVDELHRRWTARNRGAGSGGGPAVAAQPARFLPPAVEMPDHAVFVSYAREDLPAVQRLKAALDRAGITVWFDMERLEGGDDYDRKIQRNIGRCAYFVPVVSANTERRIEAYFRREWSYAIDRTRNMADGAVFILPVCIDDTVEVTARVPDKFKAAHFTRLPAGEGGDAFASRLRRLFSGDA
jgi:hypothetical protein